MSKLLFLLIAVTTFLYANDQVKIYTSSLDSKDNVVRAYGEVTVVYKDIFLYAKKAVYDRNSGDLELFDNIRANYNGNYKLLGDYAKLNIRQKKKTFKPFYMLEKKTDIWISGDEGCEIDKEFNIESGVMSGCDPNDPLWKMEFSTSEYNAKTKWLNLYNARVYIYDIPVFYTPYFGYSLDDSRQTGLLRPSLGMSDKEGFFYAQALYIAEQNWWDIEVKPQTRTNRGNGGYTRFRFVDSKVSRGDFTAGVFKENQTYFLEENLVNQTHYGYNFEYTNSDFINQWFDTTFGNQSGLYIDINNMNDVDYINLAVNNNTRNLTSELVLSRINMFSNTDRNYIASYFKYYKDLTKENNTNTLQKLPTFQYHHYLNTFLKDHLLYSLDVQSNNIYRQINKKVIQTDFNIPVTLHTSLFDEYLNLSYKTQLYAQHSSFNGTNAVGDVDEYNSGYFARNYNVLEASTQLTRAFNNFTHVIGFSSSYKEGGLEIRNGFYDDTRAPCTTEGPGECEFYNITDIDERLQLDFSQYIFDSSAKQRLYHRLAQTISYEKYQRKVGELENEIDIRFTNSIHFYNNMFYNYDEKEFSKTFNEISYNNHGFNISLSHLYKNSFIPSTLTYSPYTSYITSSARYTYNEHYSYHVSLDYDLELEKKKSSEIGFLYKKRCWDFGLKYMENNRPILTQTNNSSVYDRYVYFTILLKPLMPSIGVSPNFGTKLPETLEGL